LNVINKIMSIDKDAQDCRENTDELLKVKQNELEIVIGDMWTTFRKESKNIKNDISNKKMIEAENMAKNIIKEKEEELNNINSKYQSIKAGIVEDIYNGIIKPL